MKIKYLILFSLFINLLCIDADFNVIYKSSSTGNQFMNLIKNLYIEVELSIGSNEQKFKSELDITNYLITVPDIQFNRTDIERFNKSTSTSFTFIQDLGNYFIERIYGGFIGQDTIKIGKSESINNFKFVVGSNYLFTSGSYSYIGLKMVTNQGGLFNVNLLEQLKNNSIIDKELWYLDFTDYNSGKFVVGKFPHELDDTIYKEKDLYQTNFDAESYSAYPIKFDEIYYGNLKNYNERKLIEDHNNAHISINTRLIYCTSQYADIIHKNFFNKKLDDKVCFREKLDEHDSYYYLYCYKNKININEMDNLNFYIRDTNTTFTLTPKDLFYEHDECLYFLVVYKETNHILDDDEEVDWTLGLQFLQKFTMAFDPGDRIFYYYNIVKDNNNNKENENETNHKNLKYIIIIILLVILFVGCTTFLIFYIIKIKPRKVKVNELDENYDYETKDKGNDMLIN